MKTLICDCNRTMPLDLPALRRTLAATPGASTDGLEAAHQLLCRREAGAFQRAAKASGEAVQPLLVACTQESRLFLELNEQTTGAAPLSVRPIHFVNIRETGGWSRDAAQATPKIAALIAAAQLPDAEAVGSVAYASAGRCLVIGTADAAERAAALLGDALAVSLLVEGHGGALSQRHAHAVHSGRLTRLAGWLGAFDAEWQSANPIDLDLCTRCNACIDACPEGAIDFGYQVDLTACKRHRDCVRVCDAAGAIDFQRAPQTTAERFDLVLDLRADPAFTMHQPPQGYFHAGSDERRLMAAVLALRGLVGEFEKPRFFHYKPELCAHSRNQQIGCSACIDVCSTRAIRSEASLKGRVPERAPGRHTGPGLPPPLRGGIAVEPHLCVGCGACGTVCPSGALSFTYPGPVDQGRRLRTLLATYARAGGRDAALLIHSQGAGERLIGDLGRAARSGRSGPAGHGAHGVPARVLPLAVWHTASIGLDLWLTAFAQGASQVWVLQSDEEAPEYREALSAQMAVAEALLHGLGYAGVHLRLLEARDARDLAALDLALREPPAQGVAQPASFAVMADKRGTLELAIEHLAGQAPRKEAPGRSQASLTPSGGLARTEQAPARSREAGERLAACRPQGLTQGGGSTGAQDADEIALPAASPFGSLAVDTEACTMCLACVGACPSAALADNPERPQLRFIEKNCVQCGLCAATCPERAITLLPRLWLADEGRARKATRVLHEMAPYACVRCGKPFGTLKAIEAMMVKLAGHSAFQGVAAERLKMCGDCRVIDLHSNPNETRITDL